MDEDGQQLVMMGDQCLRNRETKKELKEGTKEIKQGDEDWAHQSCWVYLEDPNLNRSQLKLSSLPVIAPSSSHFWGIR